MRFNVAQLLKESVGARRSYSLDDGIERLSETGTTRVQGKITLTRTDKGIWVTGSLEANAFTSCSRCLSPVEHPVRFKMDEEYLPKVDINTGSPLEVPEVEEGVFTLDALHTLDLTEAVRQYVIINLPMKPLCSQSCAGLCTDCGTNLNEAACSCAERVDSRWSPLLQLLAATDVR
ncbi:MAG: DUF177 domain-containing protein [Chloroflexi bacterium]|nr:DUF177 domain-containing protein [Chloroflexota bacterium]